MTESDLGGDEAIVVETRAAASALVWPAIWVLVVAAGVGAMLGWMPIGWHRIGDPVTVAVGVVLVIVLAAVPALRWLARRFVLTTRRARVTQGLVRRTTHDVLLGHVQEVAHTRSAWQKVRGAGTLVLITTSGDRVRVPDLPQIERIHALCAELAWAQRAGRPPA